MALSGAAEQHSQLSTFLLLAFRSTVSEIDKNWAILDDSKLNWKQLN